MANLHQIVNLRTAGNVSFADTGAVDAGVGLNLHVVLDDHGHRLRDFVPVAVIIFSEAKSIAANNHPILQQHIVSQATLLADDRVGMSREVVTDFHAAINNDVRQQHGVFPDLDIFADHDVRAEVCAFADFRRCMRSLRSDEFRARTLQTHSKQSDGASECQVGILAAQHGSRESGEVFADNDGLTLSSFWPRRRTLGWLRRSSWPEPASSNPGNTCDLGIGQAVFQSRAQRSGPNLYKYPFEFRGNEKVIVIERQGRPN